MRHLLLCLMLTACASAPRHSVGDLDRDGCIGWDGRAYCLSTTTPDQIAAFEQGVIDPDEQRELDRLKLLIAADAGTTMVGLASCAVRELNPLLGSQPALWVIPIFTWAQYRMAVKGAQKSPIYRSSAKALRLSVLVRSAAVLNNSVVLAGCL